MHALAAWEKKRKSHAFLIARTSTKTWKTTSNSVIKDVEDQYIQSCCRSSYGRTDESAIKTRIVPSYSKVIIEVKPQGDGEYMKDDTKTKAAETTIPL